MPCFLNQETAEFGDDEPEYLTFFSQVQPENVTIVGLIVRKFYHYLLYI